MAPASVPTSDEFNSLVQRVSSLETASGLNIAKDTAQDSADVALDARLDVIEAGTPPVDPPPAPTLLSLFGTTTPTNPADVDAQAIEVGLKLTVSAEVKVHGVRFYKGPGNTGSHVGRLYSSTGVLLATATTEAETASGWQEMLFPSPVTLAPGNYTVSYHTTTGHYSVSTGGAVTNGPVSSTGAVYRYGTGGVMPTTTSTSHYFADLLFLATGNVPDPDPDPTTPGSLSLPRVPWDGGPAYYDKFAKAKAAGWTSPSFFPISVFYGKPEHTSQLKALGINTLQGAEHDGSTMASITNTGMFVLAQPEWTRAEVGNDPRVVGWHVSDECEMGYGGCLDSNDQYGRLAVQRQFAEGLRAYNDGRFLQANFGNGVLRTYWGTDTMDDHVALMDVSSVDKYAYTSPHVQELIPGSPDWPAGAVPKSAATYGWFQDQMERFQNPSNLKPNWVFVETAKPYLTESGATSITPAQLEGAVWSAIIHEARGIAYFQHNNDSSQGNYSLVTGAAALKAKVTAVHAKIASLAPVINSQSYVWNFAAAGIDTMLKADATHAYVFAGVGLKGTTGSKTFTLPAAVRGTSVEVVGEGRTLGVTGGKFTDTFALELTHHVYKIAL